MSRFLFLFVFSLFSTFSHADDLFPGRLSVDEKLAPFYHGIASGDPTSTQVIIWTRVTTAEPTVEVKWRVSKDIYFNNIAAEGVVSTDVSKDYTVKVDVVGLEPNTWYYYEFEAMDKLSVTGRTKTLPANSLDQFRLAVVSCSSYPHGFFNAYDRIKERNDISAIIHLGDYIYEYGINEYGNNPERMPEPTNAIVTLSDYRARYSQYHLDTMLMRLHQNFPFYNIWDDHEYANNSYKDGAENHNSATQGSWNDRKQAALQAYLEWLPIREISPDNKFKIYRSVKVGDLAEVFFLDTRIIGRDSEDAPDSPEKRLLGEEQMNWLLNGMKSSTAQWKILAQQVMVAPLQAFGLNLNPDQWDGYSFERKRLFDAINENNINNVVVLTGDIHTAWANDLPFGKTTYNSTTGEGSAGVEFVTTSVTSPGFPFSLPGALISSLNPHNKFTSLTAKGYSILDITKQKTQTDFYAIGPIFQPDNSQRFQTGYFTADGRNRLSKTPDETSATEANIALAPQDPRDKTVTTVINKPNVATILGAYPNPFVEVVGLQYYLAEAKNLRLQVIDMSGRTIVDKNLGLRIKGLQYDAVDATRLPKGQYILNLTDGRAMIGRNVIKIQ